MLGSRWQGWGQSPIRGRGVPEEGWGALLCKVVRVASEREDRIVAKTCKTWLCYEICRGRMFWAEGNSQCKGPEAGSRAEAANG